MPGFFPGAVAPGKGSCIYNNRDSCFSWGTAYFLREAFFEALRAGDLRAEDFRAVDFLVAAFLRAGALRVAFFAAFFTALVAFFATFFVARTAFFTFTVRAAFLPAATRLADLRPVDFLAAFLVAFFAPAFLAAFFVDFLVVFLVAALTRRRAPAT